MKLLVYVCIFILPLILIIAGEILTKMLVLKIESDLFRSSAYAIVGFLISIGIYFILKRIFDSLELKPIYCGNLTSFFVGIFLGTLICLVSGIGYGYFQGYDMKLTNIFNNLHLRTISNIYPAFTEELFFRGGVVEVVTQLFGRVWGMAAGSIPFGILHVLAKLFGKTVTISQVVGISLAGLMLSLVYLKLGLWGSIGCHLAWNAIVGGWSHVYGVENKGVTSAIEGSWVTCVVLTAVILGLLFLYKPAVSS